MAPWPVLALAVLPVGQITAYVFTFKARARVQLPSAALAVRVHGPWAWAWLSSVLAFAWLALSWMAPSTVGIQFAAFALAALFALPHRPVHSVQLSLI